MLLLAATSTLWATATHLLAAGSGGTVGMALAALATYLLMRKGGPTLPSGQSTIDHTSGAGVFTGMLKALEAANGQAILSEATIVSGLIRAQGGVAPLLDDLFNKLLEARLADPATKAPLLTKIATDHGVAPRALLDALEGKPPSTAPVAAAVASLVGLALILFCSTANARGPEVFLPAKREVVLDAPAFAAPSVKPEARERLLPNSQTVATLAPQPQTTLVAQSRRSRGCFLFRRRK